MNWQCADFELVSSFTSAGLPILRFADRGIFMLINSCSKIGGGN
jgi:hypothetical protein